MTVLDGMPGSTHLQEQFLSDTLGGPGSARARADKNRPGRRPMHAGIV